MSLEGSGFGGAWSLNLRKYRHRQSRAHSLVIGEHQQIIKATSRLVVKDQKLESFPFQKSGGDYQVMHVSGDIEILCNESDTATAPVKSAINVKDGAEGLLKFDCSDVELDAITSPDSSVKAITRLFRGGEDVLTKLKPPLDSGSAASHRGSLTRLAEELFHLHDGHRLPKGATRIWIPYVIIRTGYPGEQQPKITTVYRYSEFNLLGYGGVNDQDPDGDNLFDARAGHHYNSTLEVEGGADLNYICNKFHLGSSPRQQGTKSVA
ncbi:uncharacterized protein FFUJ_14110 [Fusarium fujikuroi IMI 58289]|uniref:Uncharacterized protein n=1 Tax=Gibberella fujikuroi (strain CBS 195.34 / IMI 58289 / NRRL A-6831) TaxID=1279085 RepID=S0EP99_GIBF5|nr:uncharacterized protein FFUJ_14110 [Fusarium fujikuroi IMI 58289]CCT76254.1 uncharacterized protein FFUJ_14110 [Fusarium fujikuroi IMI 58289]SCO26713.1 uncharacterized protein FFM5_14982 [Fusarium fujikuroi]SCO58570.1 uncharacterized protein FFMR_15726 [Fusarium fujikuroi]